VSLFFAVVFEPCVDVGCLSILQFLCFCFSEVRFVASWKWDIPEEDVCGICHGEFERCCPSSTCKVPGDDCPPMWGACNHAFHMHCIMRWLEAPRPDEAVPECPMCRRPWEFRGESGGAAEAAAAADAAEEAGGAGGEGAPVVPAAAQAEGDGTEAEMTDGAAET
jgi:anaphase-promoting complex subunit 11